MYVMVAIFVSVVFTNVSLSIIIAFLMDVGAALLNMFVIKSSDASLLHKIGKYIITINYDLSSYMMGSSGDFSNVTNFSTSVIMYIVYIAIFVILSNVIFKKKDIKNIQIICRIIYQDKVEVKKVMENNKNIEKADVSFKYLVGD